MDDDGFERYCEAILARGGVIRDHALLWQTWQAARLYEAERIASLRAAPERRHVGLNARERMAVESFKAAEAAAAVADE